MSLQEFSQDMIEAFKNYTWSQAMASGSLTTLTFEFITNRGEDLAFVFAAGILGAVAGGTVKWALSWILPERKKKKEEDSQTQ